MKAFKIGNKINMQGVSSFTSDKEIASNFGNIIFEVKNKTGCSIKHLSHTPIESEIISSEKTFYKILDIIKSKIKGIDYRVIMEEV